MLELVRKYARKLVAAGLAEEPLIGGLDAELVWNREDDACDELRKVFDGLNINALLFSKPAEPYFSIIEYLASTNEDAIYPNDCETRTFLHDLPVVKDFEASLIIEALKKRKSVIVPGHGIVTWGTVSPEQAFIFYSSVCFACFVKFFYDYLEDHRARTTSDEQRRVFKIAMEKLDDIPDVPPELANGPLADEESVYRAMSEVGRKTVEYHLVDSFFGNLSFRYMDTLYISQTTSSLDELEGCIDPSPLDGSSCAGITASSELTAHREVMLRTGMDAILHGHPKFSVIMSMDCLKQDCELDGQCHVRCPEDRFIVDGQLGRIPIVPGEVGTGPRGLCNTLPPAMKGHAGVIVYGHGLFTVSKGDFNKAFANMLAIEKTCRKTYFALLAM